MNARAGNRETNWVGRRRKVGIQQQKYVNKFLPGFCFCLCLELWLKGEASHNLISAAPPL